MTLFDEVLRKKPSTPDGNIFGGQFGGPTMDRTATSDWRSEDAQTSPIRSELAHRAAIAPITPNYVTKGPGGDMSNASTPIDFGSIGRGIQGASNVFSGITSGVQKWADTAPIVGPALKGLDWLTQKAQEPGQWLANSLNLPSVETQYSELARLQNGGKTPSDSQVKSASTFGGGLLNYGVAGGLINKGALGAPKIPTTVTRVAPKPLAIAPREQLALPAPRSAPLPDVIPARAAVVDTTARSVAPWEQQIADSIARQKAAPTPTEALANRAPIRSSDTGGGIFAPVLKAKPQTLAERTGALTPVGREDLSLGRGVAKPVETVAPISLDDLRSRIGATDKSGVPMDAEQLAARIGAKSRPQAINSLNNSMQVEARQARPIEPHTPATGTLGNSGMSGPLVGRAIGRGNSQLARAGHNAEGLTATPDQLGTSLARQAKVHDANEAAIAASRSGDQAALARAKADVKLLGGDLKHTEARIAQARRVTTDATTTQDFQASIDALKNKKAAGGKFMVDDLGSNKIDRKFSKAFAEEAPKDLLSSADMLDEPGSVVSGFITPSGRIFHDSGMTEGHSTMLRDAKVADIAGTPALQRVMGENGLIRLWVQKGRRGEANTLGVTVLGDLTPAQTKTLQSLRAIVKREAAQDYWEGIDPRTLDGSPPGASRLITDTQAGPESPASSLSERPKLIGMAEIRPAMIGAKEVAPNLYANYRVALPDSFTRGQFDAGKANVQVMKHVPGPGEVGPIASTINSPSGPIIMIRAGLSEADFTRVITHELEHAGQPDTMDLVSAERRAYATHGESPPPMADDYSKRSMGWYDNKYDSMDQRARVQDLQGRIGVGQRLLRDDGMSREDIAAAKARLADRMGVDPTTGRSPNESRVTPRTTAAGGPAKRITAQNLTRAAENVAGTGKTLTTAASPFHFMFRHALPFAAAHPQSWLKGSVKGLGEGFTMSPAQLDARIKTMKGNLERNGLGNVYLGKPHLGAIGGEEGVSSSWLNRLGPLGKVIQRSGQGFTQGLNEVRYEAAKGAINSSNWMAAHGLAQKMTMADRKALGDAINHFSGRGLDTANMGDTGKAVMRALNLPMFSPQLATARVRMLGDFTGALKTVAKDVATGKAPRAGDIEKARLAVGYITGFAALQLLISAATGNKPDLNPVSSTFGQTDAGDRGPAQAAAGVIAPEFGMGFNSYDGEPSRIDPSASEATLIRNMARLALSIYDRATGQSNLKTATGNQQEQTPMDVASNALLSQIFTSPIGYPMAEWLRGYGFEPLDSILPMPVTGALKGAGVQMPTIGAKEKTTTGTKTPRSGPAPTRRPVAAPTRKAG